MRNRTNKKDPITRGQSVENSEVFRKHSSWLGMRDSNPRSRDQNPLPYHLANPQ